MSKKASTATPLPHDPKEVERCVSTFQDLARNLGHQRTTSISSYIGSMRLPVGANEPPPQGDKH